jgi:hypothetical protein
MRLGFSIVLLALATYFTYAIPDLGDGASLHGARIFPSDNPWNQRVDSAPVDGNSDAIISQFSNAALHPDFGADYGGPFGIPYTVVDSGQALVNIGPISYEDESDPGPYPIPPDAPIEGGASGDGDRHVLVLDRDNWILYEMFNAHPTADGWQADSAAEFDLDSNALRPEGWTSADAAGLPILPGLVRYDEVYEQKEIRHAIRFTLQRSKKAFVHPATHYASSLTGSNYLPMGGRMRLKSSFDISGFPEDDKVILTAFKTYGLILADNGGDMFISGAPDSRWNDGNLNLLKQLHASDFEVVQLGYASEPGNESVTVCGNSVCETDETCSSCAQDCRNGPADNNPCDDCIQIDEMNDYISHWLSGSIQIIALMDTIRLWKIGC